MRKYDDCLKIALVHASIDWGEKEKNLARLLDLNEKAAGAGAKVIVNTELATSGYSFAGREEIAPLVETIPGPATRACGRVAGKYGCYICLGLPEVDLNTGVFYNAAALIGPAGQVVGKCRKLAPAYRENLWAARGNLPVLVAQTEFGRLGVVVCADSYSYKPARIAALQGARALLVPANWPPEHYNPEKFWRARAAENGIYLLACNRTGIDPNMDCRQAESMLIDGSGTAIQQVSSPDDTIIYGTLPPTGGKLIPAAPENILSRREPACYRDIALDPYSQLNPGMMLGLPEPAEFTVAAVQFCPLPGNVPDNLERLLGLIDAAADRAAADGTPLDLAVLPELCTTGAVTGRRAAEAAAEMIPGPTTGVFARKAAEKNIFIVLGMVEKQDGKYYNSIVLVGPRGVECRYRKIHLSRPGESWAAAGDIIFPVLDLPFCRAGLLAGSDLMFPESAESLVKRGADLICAPAAWSDAKRRFIWEARQGEQAHLAIANQWGAAAGTRMSGCSAIYGYSRCPENIMRSEAAAEGNGINILRLNSRTARERKFIENIDYDIILKTSVRQK